MAEQGVEMRPFSQGQDRIIVTKVDMGQDAVETEEYESSGIYSVLGAIGLLGTDREQFLLVDLVLDPRQHGVYLLARRSRGCVGGGLRVAARGCGGDWERRVHLIRPAAEGAADTVLLAELHDAGIKEIREMEKVKGMDHEPL